MKILLMFLGFGILVSCSSLHEKKSLTERIQAEQVRSLQEINSHANLLLSSHPELDETTKNELKNFLKIMITKQQSLNDEESKIFQLLLKKSFRVNQLTDKELSDKSNLKMRLKDVYDEKFKNSLALISKIVNLFEQNSVSESFRNDMMNFMTGFR